MITRIETTKVFDSRDKSPKDVVNFVNYLMNCSMGRATDKSYMMTLSSATRVDSEDYPEMTVIEFTVNVYCMETKENSRHVWRCFRAHDYSCMNIQMNIIR